MSHPNHTSFPNTPRWVPVPPESPPRLRIERLVRTDQARIATVRSALIPEDFPVKQLVEHPINVFDLKDSDRIALLAGPKISVIADGNVVIRKGVFTRALMASCTKLHDLLHARPLATQFRVYGELDRKCIEELLDTFTTGKGLKADDTKLTSDGIVKNILMYQACISLGIVYHHTVPLLHALRAEITARLLMTDEMNTIVNRIPPTDPLFKHLVNDLCYCRFKKQIPDIAAFEKWLGNKKTLQRVMVEIDKAHRKRRKTIDVRNCNWRSGSETKKPGRDDEEEKTEAEKSKNSAQSQK